MVQKVPEARKADEEGCISQQTVLQNYGQDRPSPGKEATACGVARWTSAGPKSLTWSPKPELMERALKQVQSGPHQVRWSTGACRHQTGRFVEVVFNLGSLSVRGGDSLEWSSLLPPPGRELQSPCCANSWAE
ncbi:hypothetical protein P4O66_006934 [Electrophorus voltai]|uniref:Uncharacterized protein n=1 Tax=Electrophorus voltai TaxID=2609070 RepID=A0AAD8ZGI5_9TELE|nr:hypothetical protein P4O66_006934 [Electrophorus voltai]